MKTGYGTCPKIPNKINNDETTRRGLVLIWSCFDPGIGSIRVCCRYYCIVPNNVAPSDPLLRTPLISRVKSVQKTISLKIVLRQDLKCDAREREKKRDLTTFTVVVNFSYIINTAIVYLGYTYCNS